MLFGSKTDFAIHIEHLQTVDGWALGRLLFWIGSIPIGDPTDSSVHLKGCADWLRDFATHDRDRYEIGLFNIDRVSTYERLTDPAVGSPGSTTESLDRESLFSRFDVSVLGGSSFDRVTLLLLENETGGQRFVWRQGTDSIREAFLPPRTAQSVARECVEWCAANL
jgi:hypothetical protein